MTKQEFKEKYDVSIGGISEEEKKDMGVALDMFIANAQKGEPIEGQPWYDGYEEGTDWAEVKEDWDSYIDTLKEV